jgi:tetratricopeptide (TPR) repeat protein
VANAFSSSGKRTLIICLLLALGTLVLYSRAVHAGFLRYDDDRYVVENPYVRAGIHWSTVAWAFTTFEQANWHPLTWLSHALDCQLFGMNPAGHHAINLSFHAASVVLLFLVLQWLTGYTGRSLAVAVLFAVHPVNVESVAWIAERKNVLCMFFFLITLLAWVRYVRRPRLVRYMAVLLGFAMALTSKPMAITLPFVLLLLDYWPLRRLGSSEEFAGKDSQSSGIVMGEKRSISGLIIEKLPLFAMSAASAVVTMKAQRAGGAVAVKYSVVAHLQNAIVSYVLYIGKAIWPARLAALYPYPTQGWSARVVVLSALFLVIVTALVVRYREHRYLLWGWFWFLGTMVPMIGLVQVGNQAMADRYAYLPFIGLFVMFVWGIAELASRFSMQKYIAASAVVIVIAFCAVTHRQLAYWHDDFSLWSHTLAVTHRNFVAEDNFGNALIKAGKYDEGIAHFRNAAEIEPGDPVSEVNLGIYAQQHGDLQQAAARYQYALQLASDPQVRAAAYANLGGVYFTLKDYARAKENLEAALNLNSRSPFIFLHMGLIAQKNSDWNSATSYYATYVAVEPTGIGYFLLGQALEHAGDSQRAKLAYQQAQRSSRDLDQTSKAAAKLLAE